MMEGDAPEKSSEGDVSEGPGVAAGGPEVAAESPGVAAEGPKVAAESPEVAAGDPGVAAEGPEVAAEGPEVAAGGLEVIAEGPGVAAGGPEVAAESPGVAGGDKGTVEDYPRRQAAGSVDADEALRKLRRYGKWRVLIYSLICLGVNIPGTWLMLSIVFIGGEPDGYICKREDNGTTGADGGSSEIVPFPRTAKHCFTSPPRVDRSQPSCPGGYVYYTTTGPTIVTDWDLVCNRDYLSETSQMVFGAGVMAGALFIPSIADRFGRRPVHIVCQWIAICFGVGIAFSDSITTFTVLRFILGALREGLGLSGIVLACELFPAEGRPVAGIALQFFWSVAWMLLALLAYLIRQWRHLQLALSLISVLPAIAVFFVPESVVWLVAKGKLEKAEEILQKARRFDGDAGSEDHFLLDYNQRDGLYTCTDEKNATELSTFEKRETEKEKNGSKEACAKHTEVATPVYSIFSICRSGKLCMYTVSMCILWFINIVVYYGLSLGTSLIPGGNRYLFFFLSGLVEIPAYGFALILIKAFGRRVPLSCFHFVAAVGLFGQFYGNVSNDTVTEAAMSMLGKFGITASLAILVLYANEIFPTTLRNAGFGLAATAGRLGGILAPMSVYWAKQNQQVPVLVFGVLALVAVVAGIALPETANRPLPNTVEEVEQWQPGWASFFAWSKERASKACSCEDSDTEDDVKDA